MKKVTKTNKEMLQAQLHLARGDASIDLAHEGKSVQERRDSLTRIVNSKKKLIKTVKINQLFHEISKEYGYDVGNYLR